jgi:hypothetical protein
MLENFTAVYHIRGQDADFIARVPLFIFILTIVGICWFLLERNTIFLHFFIKNIYLPAIQQ